MGINQERRKFKRVREKFNVKINKIEDGTSITSVEVGKSHDVSACGILIKHDKAFKIDDRVNVNFMKPNTFDIFNCEGKIVRVEKNSDGSFLLGIEFLGLSEEELTTLDHLLTK